MVEIFKTSVIERTLSQSIIIQLQCSFPRAIINFDLEDVDKILRIEDDQVNVSLTKKVLDQHGVQCERLI
jgi:hypothetical protein